MRDELERPKTIPGTYVFDGRMSEKGYRLNKLANSLNSADNRAAYKDDEEAYYDRFDLTDAEKDLLRARDWLGIIKAGGNIYFIMKIGFLVGEGLYPMGAKQRGQTYEEFLATRGDRGAT